MDDRTDSVRLILSRGPATARQLVDLVGVSQPVVSRLLSAVGEEVVRVRAGRSIRYALRERGRGFGDIPVYRVSDRGQVASLGTLIPVHPGGFVMVQDEDGQAIHSDGLPWWLLDMRPAGFLGRAYAAQNAASLGLPPRLSDWSDSDVLRALLTHGHDAVGNLLLGDVTRERFLSAPVRPAIPRDDRGSAYARLAAEAARGDGPGTSAGGEQPKFAAYAEGAEGRAHVLVKFTLPRVDAVTARWADLLLAEHHAMSVLRESGVQAARTEVIDFQDQRFLEVERFDRRGELGRIGLMSLLSLDAEFAGVAPAPWPIIVARLASEGVVSPESTGATALLYAYGELIGNTDMHAGNLSFVGAGRPYSLAPAYDMLPMGFAPQAGGLLPDSLRPPNLRAEVHTRTWVRALALAEACLARLQAESRWTSGWAPCLQALAQHLDTARGKVARLG